MLYIDSLLSRIPNLNLNPFMKELWTEINLPLVLKFLVIYFTIVWISVIVWVIKDITNRTSNLVLQILSVAIVLFLTPFGIFLYLIIRPWKTISEKYYWEIEENLESLSWLMKEKDIQKQEDRSCHKCWEKLEESFKYCPNCEEKLKKNCRKCKKEIRTSWDVCPYCWDKFSKEESYKKEVEQKVIPKKDWEKKSLKKLIRKKNLLKKIIRKN